MTVPSMRDLISLYENATKEDNKVDYYDSGEYSDKERVNRMVPTELKGKAQNPNDSASLGKDGENKATNNFSHGEKLEKIDQLRKQIEILERLSHKADLGLSKEDSGEIDKVIEKLRKEADELSDILVDVV